MEKITINGATKTVVVAEELRVVDSDTSKTGWEFTIGWVVDSYATNNPAEGFGTWVFDSREQALTQAYSII